jgi:hypothetical protein
MGIIVSEASNRYTHLFLVERQYFGFNTLEIVIVEYYNNIVSHTIMGTDIHIGIMSLNNVLKKKQLHFQIFINN